MNDLFKMDAEMTRTELMRKINDLMTFAGHSLTEDQDAVLCAALQTLIPDYFQPRPEINQQLLEALKANHIWHIAYDEFEGYAESDLYEQNMKAITAAEKEIEK